MNPKDNRRIFLGLICWLALHFAVAAVSSLFRPGAWHAALEKPSWHPPNWLFPPVWTTLYTLLSLSAWLVWKKAGFENHARIWTIYLIHLALNLLWSPIFFGAHLIGFALVEMALLWISIIASIKMFWKISRPAAALLVPYLLWVSFALALNFSLWRLNS
ncbi:MAG: TspO/MBR family protein [Verrucomicrobiales bacterium]